MRESKKNHVPHVLSDGLGVKIRNEFKFKSVFSNDLNQVVVSSGVSENKDLDGELSLAGS